MSTWHPTPDPPPPRRLDDVFPRGADCPLAWQDGWTLLDLERDLERAEEEAEVPVADGLRLCPACAREFLTWLRLRRVLAVPPPRPEGGHHEQ